MYFVLFLCPLIPPFLCMLFSFSCAPPVSNSTVNPTCASSKDHWEAAFRRHSPHLQDAWEANGYVQRGLSHPQVILSAAGATQASRSLHFGYFSQSMRAHGRCGPFTCPWIQHLLLPGSSLCSQSFPVFPVSEVLPFCPLSPFCLVSSCPLSSTACAMEEATSASPALAF